MSSRIKSSATIITRAEFDSTVDEICRLQIEKEQRVTLRDRLLLGIMEEHNPEIEKLGQDIAARLVLCEKFALTNRDTLFGKLKSAAANLGTFGFRIGNPTLRLLNRKWKWDLVLDALKASGMTDCVRTKEEPDKDALKKLDDGTLANVGLKIEQEETFYIEPHRQNPERIQS